MFPAPTPRAPRVQREHALAHPGRAVLALLCAAPLLLFPFASAARAADKTPPAAPTGLKASAGDAKVVLDWNNNTERDLKVYYVYRRVPNGTWGGPKAQATSSAYTDTSAANGTRYEYRVRAVDTSYNLSQPSSTVSATPVAADRTPPAAPAFLTANAGDAKVALDWASNAEGDLAGYRVYRRNADGSWPTTALAAPSASDHTDLTVANGTGYAYRVTAVDKVGNESAASSVVSATPVAPDTTAPLAPAGLLATAGDGSVALDWSDNGESDLADYRVYRRNADGSWPSAPLASRDVSALTDSGLTNGTGYAYRVTAVDEVGNESPASNVASATPVAPSHAANLFVSVSGSDAGSCTQAAPCRSFGYAYRAARAGQVVEVAAGSYPTQQIDLDSTKTSSEDVVFRPAAGASVTTGQISVYGRHVEFQDMTVSGWYARQGAEDLTFRDLIVRGGIFVTSASNINIVGGEVGPGDSYDSQIKASNTTGAPVPTNILIDGVDFHDWTRVANPAAHIECLQFGAGDGITIRNSRFRNCETQGLFFRSWGGTARIRNVTIENNFFDATTVGYYPLRIATFSGVTYDNIQVRYNSGLQSFLIDEGSTTNVRWVGNVAPRSRCTPGQTYSHNVWQGAACSATDKNAAAGFTNPTSTDLHLTTTAAAIGAGDPNDHPTTDIDGQPRNDGAPDAGADER